MVKEEIISGIRNNSDFKNKTFTSAYFHFQQEIEAEFTESGFTIENSFGVGLAWSTPDLGQILTDSAKKERLRKVAAMTEKHSMQRTKILTVGIKH